MSIIRKNNYNIINYSKINNNHDVYSVIFSYTLLFLELLSVLISTCEYEGLLANSTMLLLLLRTI